MAALENNVSPPKDTIAFGFLIAMILVAAVMFGVGVSGIANGTVHDLLRTAGFGANAEMRAELLRRKAEIADVTASLDSMIGENAKFDARTKDLAERDAAQAQSLAKLDEEMAMLKAKFRALLPDDPLQSLADGGTDLLTLRTTLDAQAEHNRHQFNSINKRIDYLENMIAAPPDVTGSVHPPEKQKRHGAHRSEGSNAARGN
jgi:parvulin-like peptidyl-prolyl isomerase